MKYLHGMKKWNWFHCKHLFIFKTNQFYKIKFWVRGILFWVINPCRKMLKIMQLHACTPSHPGTQKHTNPWMPVHKRFGVKSLGTSGAMDTQWDSILSVCYCMQNDITTQHLGLMLDPWKSKNILLSASNPSQNCPRKKWVPFTLSVLVRNES